jgi:hypothetical protein
MIYVKVSNVTPHAVLQIPSEEERPASPSEPAVSKPETVSPQTSVKTNPVTLETARSSDPQPAAQPEAAEATIGQPTGLRPVSRSVVQVTQATPPPPADMQPQRSVFVPQPAAPAVNETGSGPSASPAPERAEETIVISPQPSSPPQPRPAASTSPAPTQPHVVTLQPGTSVVVRLGETLSTEHNYAGDTFRGTLDLPITVDGFIIAEKGSKVLGKIVGADRPGHLTGTAGLHLTLTEINTTDGQRVPVATGPFDKKGPSNTVAQTAKLAGGAAIGAIIGAVSGGGKGAAIGAGVGGAAGAGAVLLSRGKPAVLPAETTLTFQLTIPATITEKLN